MSPTPVIQIRDLRRNHLHAGGAFSLHVPALALYAAQTSVFQGESGCGKSTLFDMLGLIAPANSAEEFLIFREGCRVDVSGASEAVLTALRGQTIGYVLQHGGLIPSLTISENILMPCRLSGTLPDKDRFEHLVTRLGITDQLRKKPAKLSGGQLQRAAIARALIHRPAIVLADEPTGQLDAFTAADVRELLLTVAREENASLLVVTHDPQLFNASADRCFGFETRMKDGRVFSVLHELPATSMRS